MMNKRFLEVEIYFSAVDIASASGARRPGFKSRQGIMVLGKHSSAVVYKMTKIFLKEV
jgi:hypothetical protein